MAVLPRARRFTVAEYERMVKAGVFRRGGDRAIVRVDDVLG